MSLTPVGLRFKHLEYAITCGSSARKTPLSAMVSRHFKQRNAHPINPKIRCYSVLPKKEALQNNPLTRTLFRERSIPLIPEGAFGKAEWKRCYGVDVGEVPPLPGDIYTKLAAPCPFWPDKAVGETHLLVLIPATVNGQPYNLDTLRELIKKPNDPSRATYYDYYWSQLQIEQGKTPPEKSRWVLMPKDVVPDSREKTRAEQQAIAESKPGYRLPTLLEAATVILMRYAQTGERIFDSSPWTFTCCREQPQGWKLVVGCFSGQGIYVNYLYDRVGNVGVAPIQEF